MGWHFLLPGIFPPRDQMHISCVSCIAGRFFMHQAIRKSRYRPREFSDNLRTGTQVVGAKSQPLESCVSAGQSCLAVEWMGYTMGLQAWARRAEAVWSPAALGTAAWKRAVFSFLNPSGLSGWGVFFVLLEPYHSQCQGQWGWKYAGLQCNTKGYPN